MNESQNIGSITIDDVRAAVAAGATNAKAARTILGRGSFATIQKHLEALREEVRAAAEVPSDAANAPVAPVDDVNLIWKAAWAAASSRVMSRLETLSQQRDAAIERANAAENDVSALSVALDEAESVRDAAKLELEQSKADAQAAAVGAAAALEKLANQAAAADATASKQLNDVTHKLDLEVRDRMTERVTLQATIDRQLEQLIELRLLLSQLKPPQGK